MNDDDLANIAELLHMVLVYPKQCADDGIEAVARRQRVRESVVDLADRLAAWKRSQREQEAA